MAYSSVSSLKIKNPLNAGEDKKAETRDFNRALRTDKSDENALNLLVVNIGKGSDSEGAYVKHRRDTIATCIKSEQPDIVFAQEIQRRTTGQHSSTWGLDLTDSLKAKKAVNKDLKYKFQANNAGNQAGIIFYNEGLEFDKEFSVTEKSDVWLSLRDLYGDLTSEIATRLCIIRLKKKIKDGDDIQFLAASWHGPNPSKTKLVECLLHVLDKCRSVDMPKDKKLPIVIGGDFNTDLEIELNMMKHPMNQFSFQLYEASDRRKPKYFFYLGTNAPAIWPLLTLENDPGYDFGNSDITTTINLTDNEDNEIRTGLRIVIIQPTQKKRSLKIPEPIMYVHCKGPWKEDVVDAPDIISRVKKYCLAVLKSEPIRRLIIGGDFNLRDKNYDKETLQKYVDTRYKLYEKEGKDTIDYIIHSNDVTVRDVRPLCLTQFDPESDFNDEEVENTTQSKLYTIDHDPLVAKLHFCSFHELFSRLRV